MTYTVVVVDSVTRICQVDVEADNEEEAEQMASAMYDDGELDDDMEELDDSGDFVDAYVKDDC